MVNPGTNRTLNFDPERGAIRIWYQPAWSGAWTGQGSGPGELARLLTLVATNGSASAEWWSLVITSDGNELHVVCETEAGPSSCLSALINWEAGSWHMLAVGYTPTNSALIVDGQVVATGSGLASLPPEAAPCTTLVVGSGLTGRNTAKGQFEQLSTFTGRSRFRAITGYPFGMGMPGDVEFYYAVVSPRAAMGPITPQEEETRRQRAVARRVELLASQDSTSANVSMSLLQEEQLDSYDPELGFWLSSPSVQGTNVVLTIANANTNLSYDILYAPLLGTNAVWNILSTGTVGQVSFTIPMIGSEGWFRGAEGTDWDGDGIPNWMDANPLGAGVGALSLTIDSPANGSTLY